MIPIDELVVGQRYKGEGRNFDVGVWNGTGFVGMRLKFGTFFEDEELHWDADTRYGTFRPEALCDVQ